MAGTGDTPGAELLRETDAEGFVPPLARRLLTHGAWALVGRLVSSGSGVLISILLTRLLTPAEVGAYFLALSIVTVAALTARGGLETTALQLITNALALGHEGRVRATVQKVLVLATVATAGLALVIAVGGGRWVAIALFSSESMAQVGRLMALWMAYIAGERLIAEIFRGFHDIPRASVYDGAVSRSLCVLALALVLVFAGTSSLRTIVLLTVACGGIGLVPAALALKNAVRRLARASATSISTEQLLYLAWPLFVSNITLYMMGHADLWILGGFRPEAEVALYGVAARLVLLVGVSLTIANAILPPVIGDLYAKDEIARLETVVRTTATAAAIPAVVVLLAFIVAGGPILTLAFGPFYSAAGLVLALLSVGQLVNVSVGSCGYMLIMSGHQRDLMKSAIAAGSVSILGSLVAVSRFGAVGVATAVATGTTVQQLLMWWFARRRCGVWTHASPLYVSPLLEQARDVFLRNGK